ncbi:SUMF1/EgtB/PvdO family nonheme iron enzyme, partial [Bacteroidota bacterium]
ASYQLTPVTGYHWASGAGFRNDLFSSFGATPSIPGSQIKPYSNFNGDEPAPVGQFRGINNFGAYDMAGNVREWCWNEYQTGRVVRGGSWDDAEYMYENWSQLPSFNRSPKNGFRCVKYLNKGKIPASIFGRIELPEQRDHEKVVPVSEDIFRVYKNQFLYDSIPLNVSIEYRDESPEDWILEKVTFNAAYENDRVIAYLYLPANTKPPYQTLIFYPGIGAIWQKDLPNWFHINWFINYVVKNGRAVMFPVYNGTFERNKGLTEWKPSQSHQYTDWLTNWVKDFCRSVDYLETRQDINIDKLGYYGHSWGASMGGIIPAIEDRLKASILVTGGLWGNPYPEADAINYLPRINIPVLMLNGKYDVIFPFDRAAKPFFNLLGTPEKDKRLIVYETDHGVHQNEMIKETLAFLDKYFGPVETKTIAEEQ